MKAASKLPTFMPPPKPNVSHLPLLDVSMLPQTKLMHVLGHALTLKRDHGSITEASFVAWLCDSLPISMIDTHGNVHVDLRTRQNHRTLFTAHTDTVHRSGGVNKVRVDGKFWRADGAPLGADDGAGIALLCHMIENSIPGYYIFFRGEECGGIGSSGLAEDMPELLADFDRAVAFDRAGYHDVITHQAGGRCCSDDFAQALSAALTTDDFSLAFQPCDGGVYTDTAEFVHIIPECTNLSVGYKSQHGEWEEQDVEFLVALADQIVKVQWDDLVVVRDPRTRTPKGATTVNYGVYGSVYTDWRDDVKKVNATKSSYDWPVKQIDYDDLDILAIEACEEWLDGVSETKLMMLIAEQISPDNPNIVLQAVNSKNLKTEHIEEAMDNLYEGWPAEGVLDDLYDIAASFRR